MGKRARNKKSKRLRNSKSDSGNQVNKQFKHDAMTNNNDNENIYEVLRHASNIFCGEQGDLSLCESDTDISVFPPNRQHKSGQSSNDLSVVNNSQSVMTGSNNDSRKLDQNTFYLSIANLTD